MKRADIAYLAAGIVGLAVALFGAIGAPRLENTADAAAIINGAPIPREALARAVLALEADSRNPVTPEREAEVLERLIEEELLVQRGVELGLAETDFAARRALVQSVLQLALAERAGAEPTDDELRRFYRDNAGYFAPAQQFAASILFFRAGAERSRIEAARSALAQGAAPSGLGDPTALPMPRGALPQAEWARYIGTEAAAVAANLAPGEIADAVEGAGGVYLIRLDGFVAAPAPAYERVAEQVRAEYERRADEAAARAYIERLRRSARIERRDIAP